MSSLESDGFINPKPFELLKNFTTPSFIILIFNWCSYDVNESTRLNIQLEYQERYVGDTLLEDFQIIEPKIRAYLNNPSISKKYLVSGGYPSLLVLMTV